MPIGGLLGRIGSGVTNALDRLAYNGLGGGLLGQALPDPNQQPQAQVPPTPQQPQQSVGADEMGPQAGLLAQPQSAPQPQQQQQFQPNDQQRRQMRAQLLTSLGGALSQSGNLGVGIRDGMQAYQQNAVGQLQAGKAAQDIQQHKLALQGFQAEMQAAGSDPAKQQAVVLKYSVILPPQEIKAIGDLQKDYRVKPESDEVVGQPFSGTDPATGKAALLMRTKTGKIIPVPGYVPPASKIENTGNGVLLNPETGLTSPHVMKVDGKPQSVVLDGRNGVYIGANGVPIPKSSIVEPNIPSPKDLTGRDRVLMTLAGGNPDDEKTWTPDVTQKFETLAKPPKERKDTSASDIAALDRESSRFAKPYEKNVADASSQLDKIAEAKALINGTAPAQALGIPKVLTALVSGAGSGVRITQAEMNSIAHARGIQGDFQGWLNKVQGQGVLTATQQRQLTSILDEAEGRISQKRQVSSDALDGINSARSRDEISRIDHETRGKLMTSTPTAQPTALPALGAQFNGGKVLKITRIK